MDKINRRFVLLGIARELYIKTGVTKNITRALHKYCEGHPEECAGIPESIRGAEEERRLNILDFYIRPKCRKCGAPLFWHQGCGSCKGPVKKNYWQCKACGFKHITKNTLQEAIKKLSRKGETEHGN